MCVNECRVCEYSQDFNQPPDKTLCCKKRKIVKRNSLCDDFKLSHIQEFINKCKEKETTL